MTTAVSNPFGESNQDQSVANRPTNAIAEAAQAREVAEVKASMGIAKMYPRDPMQAMDKILQACTRPRLAEAALYSYSRGGSEITGPSIRLAEAMAQSWGNIQFGIRELSQEGGVSTVEAFAWDVETNTRQTKVFQVSHIRNTKKGSYALTDSRDIYENVANNGARRLRACILGIIPGDVTEAAVQQCEETMNTSVNMTPERIIKMREMFESHGIKQSQIEKRIQCRLEAIRPAQAVQLGKILNSLKDGMSKPEDWFDPEEKTAPTEKPTAPAAGSRASQMAADLGGAK